MPIRPIDMQTMLPRIQKQHNAKEVVVHKEQNAQHNAQMKNEEVTRKKLQKVQKNEQKDTARIREKEREEKDKGKKGKHSKKKEKRKLIAKDDKDKESSEKPFLRRSHFDMKI